MIPLCGTCYAFGCCCYGSHSAGHTALAHNAGSAVQHAAHHLRLAKKLLLPRCVGADSLGRCKLQVLQLGGDEKYSEGSGEDLTRAWVAQALREVQPSLRALGMYGQFHPDAIEAVATLGQLRVLCLSALNLQRMPPAALRGKLWRGLRALRWMCLVPLPKASSPNGCLLLGAQSSFASN